MLLALAWSPDLFVFALVLLFKVRYSASLAVN